MRIYETTVTADGRLIAHIPRGKASDEILARSFDVYIPAKGCVDCKQQDRRENKPAADANTDTTNSELRADAPVWVPRRLPSGTCPNAG